MTNCYRKIVKEILINSYRLLAAAKKFKSYFHLLFLFVTMFMQEEKTLQHYITGKAVKPFNTFLITEITTGGAIMRFWTFELF